MAMSGKCPRCGTPVSGEPDARGLVACVGCGVWLRGVARPTPEPIRAIPSAPEPEPPPLARPMTAAERAPETTAAEPPAISPAPASSPAPAEPSAAPPVDLRSLVQEIHDLRRMQAEILQLQAQILTALRSWPAPGASQGGGSPLVPFADEPALAAPASAAPRLPRVRQRRKTVLVIDDDEVARRSVTLALERAQVPVRGAADGRAGLAAISAEKPDVVVLELDLGEPMPGRDFVNTLRATMEWVDVRLVLHTRLPIASEQEARVQHGADDVVLKGPGSPEALVNRVIALFQRA